MIYYYLLRGLYKCLLFCLQNLLFFTFKNKLNICLFFAYMHIIKLLLSCVYFPGANAWITPKGVKTHLLGDAAFVGWFAFFS